MNYVNCKLCPRECGADRNLAKFGACRCPDIALVAKTMLHKWEEPALAGNGGSGAIFFGGCTLGCAFCQNRAISGKPCGALTTSAKLRQIMEDLIAQGAENIDLVTPTQYLPTILPALEPKLPVPVVYNCGGYESVETIDALAGLVDIYMPDLKYFSPKISLEYSGAKDYFKVAKTAILRMQQQVGAPVVDPESGMMVKGVLVRHLVLPGCRKDSIAVMEQLSTMFTPDDFLLSLMSQYTPDFVPEDCPHENLRRRITSLEYESVVREVEKYGFRGFIQQRSSASASYTPTFEG